MHHTAKVIRTIPHFFWNELKAVTLQLKVERKWSPDVSEMIFSQSISGSVFFCGQDNIYRHLQDFEGNLIDPPPAWSASSSLMCNFQFDLPIPEYIHDVWKGGDWHLRIKVLLGSLGLEFESEIYDAPRIAWDQAVWENHVFGNDHGFVTTPSGSTGGYGETSYQQEQPENSYHYAPTPGRITDAGGEVSDQQEQNYQNNRQDNSQENYKENNNEENQIDESKPYDKDFSEQTITPDGMFEDFTQLWDRIKCEDQDRLMGLFSQNPDEFEKAMRE